MKARGSVFKYGDNVDTDVIIPARYLNIADPVELATHCMEDIDTEFVKNVKKGDIMVATKNFGCGSSREHAPQVIRDNGISCVIASSFARISIVLLSTSVCRLWRAKKLPMQSVQETRSRLILIPALSPTSQPVRRSRQQHSRRSCRTSFPQAVCSRA